MWGGGGGGGGGHMESYEVETITMTQVHYSGPGRCGFSPRSRPWRERKGRAQWQAGDKEKANAVYFGSGQERKGFPPHSA